MDAIRVAVDEVAVVRVVAQREEARQARGDGSQEVMVVVQELVVGRQLSKYLNLTQVRSGTGAQHRNAQNARIPWNRRTRHRNGIAKCKDAFVHQKHASHFCRQQQRPSHNGQGSAWGTLRGELDAGGGQTPS